MLRPVTLGLALLRTTALGALALLWWNPAVIRREPEGAPLVLLDASLSMAGQGGRWRAALDTARTLAHGGVIWRFGARVTAFDTAPPTEGASRLAPALAAAAARGGGVIVVSDGAISDLADVAPDLVRRARIVVLERAPFFDAFVAAVDGPSRVSAGDTVRLTVTYGSTGPAPAGGPPRAARLVVLLGGRRLTARAVPLPASGTVATELVLPPALLPAGWSALEVRLEGVADPEPRDDARRFVVDVTPEPAVVLLAAPPDWETRFLARTLSDVARVPLKTYVNLEPGGSRWRDAATLALVPRADIARAVVTARLVIEAGDPAAVTQFAVPGAVLFWPLGPRRDGDWYVQPPPPSPLAGALAGVAWDSLPPATTLMETTPDSATTSVALTARLARRGAARPVVLLAERGGTRRAVIAAGGLYRWVFRGGASAEAYRSLIAALSDWLLEGGSTGAERFAPVALAVANGMPLPWRWTGAGPPRDVALELTNAERATTDTLHFDAGGRGELRLPPGVYRYAAPDGRERGLVAVERYSDEWRPVPATLAAQPGAPTGRLGTVALRDRWWLFIVALAAFAGEWAWRRRQGLP
ncbi:MAG TPA: hypothetical protein VEU55_07285 [Gemmatimonadales bacterium]|nr:hypothetical protein [Gemmatimonadales bacterium]